MSGENRGKQFEGQIRQAFEAVPDTSVIRLIDPQNGFAGVKNICDFVVYHYPHQYLIECKSCHGASLPFSNITDTQWELAERAKLKGVIAGYIIWFIDKDITVFVQADKMAEFKANGDKSFNVAKHPDSDYTIIMGKKKRVLYEYDLGSFLNNYQE